MTRTLSIGAAAAALLLAAGAAARSVTISNVVPRRDTDGAILDAHDGKVVFDAASATYFWVAASYGNCTEPKGDSGCSGAAPGACGFELDHNVSVYSSRDLVTWEDRGVVLSVAPLIADAVLFCPKMIHCRRTNRWVLWFNWISGSDFSQSFYAVATAASPLGPFSLVTTKVALSRADVGDFNLLEDGDVAYVIYTSHIVGTGALHVMTVEQLTDDFTGTLGASRNSGPIGVSNVEAPALFKRGPLYYAVFGQCCCYCQEGSPVTVYVSASGALGPYAARNVISARGAAGDAISAQQSDIFAWTDASGDTQFMWYGDRWQSAPDGKKAHDFTYWGALGFTPDGNITAMVEADSFTINVP